MHVCLVPSTPNVITDITNPWFAMQSPQTFVVADGPAVKPSLPVIFVTAFPERLLTGERPEPTYLITKPFQEETVRAAISQALFLGTTESRKIAA